MKFFSIFFLSEQAKCKPVEKEKQQKKERKLVKPVRKIHRSASVPEPKPGPMKIRLALDYDYISSTSTSRILELVGSWIIRQVAFGGGK